MNVVLPIRLVKNFNLTTLPLLTSLALICCLPVAGQYRAKPEPYRASGQAIKVIDLSKTAEVTEIEAATQAFREGHIIRIVGGSAADLRRMIAPGAVDTEVAPINKLARSSHVTPRVVAVRLGTRGELVQFIGREFSNEASDGLESWRQSFENWRKKEAGEAAAEKDPSDGGSWTRLLTIVSADHGEWGDTQVTLRVYRGNESERDWDYYMVLTDPEIKPKFTAQGCASLFFKACGWYTAKREINYSITRPEKSFVLQHGPNNPITTDSGVWTIGGSINGLVNGAFTQSWNQLSVRTTDNTTPGGTKASWSEQFREEEALKDLPETSTGTFVSHQGAVLQVPGGTTSFGLNVTIQASLIYQPAFGAEQDSGSIFAFSGPITPPQFSVSPQAITIAPGKTGEIQVVANVQDGDLHWKVSDKLPEGISSVNPPSGPRSQELQVTLKDDAKLNDKLLFNVDTDPAYSAPTAQDGPLTVQVIVGQPDTDGVLLAGGRVGIGGSLSTTSAAELYGVDANQFVNGGVMKLPREQHTATLLQDGTILIAGGKTSSEEASATAELFDPLTMSFAELNNGLSCPGAAGCMTSKGAARAAVRLDNGKVFICGGFDEAGKPLQTAELYDPQTKVFTAVAPMNQPRAGHTATLMWNKQVLIVGGRVDLNGNEISTIPEVYDPPSNGFTVIGNPNSPRSYHTATALEDGTVLLAGGVLAGGSVTDTAEIYFPNNATFQQVGGLQQARYSHSATLLAGGKVLIAGGQNNSAGSEATAEIFDPVSKTFSTVLSSMVTPRSNHTATGLANGKVFLAGGLDARSHSSISTTEIFDPSNNTFAPGPNFAGADRHTATALRLSSTVTLKSSANPSATGQTITITATVNVSNPAAIKGNVAFLDNGAKLGTANVTNGVATLTVKLQTGTHPVTAQFSGDDSYSPSASRALLQQVEPVTSTLTLTSSANPSVLGQEITLTSQISASGDAPLTGTMQFLDNRELIGEAPVTSKTVDLKVSKLGAGSHSVTAVYSGDQNYGGASSQPLTQRVNGIASQVTLVSSSNPAAFGASVTFEAKVTYTGAPGPTPTGRISFLDGDAVIQVVALNNGVAAFATAALAQGRHLLSAVYAGDTTYSPSTSAVLNQTIGIVGTITTLAFSKNPMVYGQDPVSAVVSVTATGDLKPTGTVSLKEGSNVLASGSLDPNGQAILAYPSGLNAGTHMLTAVYNGGADFGTSTSEPGTLRVDASPTTTVLTVFPTSPSFGQNLSLSATVGPERGKQTGAVLFHDGTKPIGTVQLTNGLATLSEVKLSGGPHSVTAVYAGDTNYNNSQSLPTNLTVAPATATITLNSSPNPSPKGQPLKLTATITSAAGVPTGKVSFLDAGNPIGLSDVVAGVAALDVSTLGVGRHSLTAAYNSDGNFSAPPSNLVNQTVNGAPATISLQSSQNPSPAGSSVTFNATINVQGANPATGLLSFYDGTIQIGTAPIVNNAGSFSTSRLSSGNHPITTKWAGDVNYESAVSNAVNQVVDPAMAPTATTLQSSKNPSAIGERVTIQASVAAEDGSGRKPTGTVTFMDGASPLGSPVPLSGGLAIYSTSGLTSGPHSLTATYSGDGNFSRSVSTSLAQNVSAVAATTVTLTSSVNPSVVGSPVNFAATVQSTSGAPTGNVTFFDGQTTLGTSALVGAAATLPVNALSVGSHNIRADYAGDPNHASASSNTLPQQVGKVRSTLILSSNPNPSMPGQTVTFTASVMSPLGISATGTVQFLDGNVSLGTVPMNNGVATISTSALTSGNHSITGIFSGNSNMQPDTSQIYSQVVSSRLPVTLILSSSPNPSKEGQSVVFTARVTVTDGGIPTGSVTLSQGVRIFGSSFLQNGVAIIATKELTAGDYQIAGTYGGDSRYSGATSSTVQQHVDPAQAPATQQ